MKRKAICKMKQKIKVLCIGSLLAIVLVACQSSSGATPPGFSRPAGSPMGTPNPDMMTQIASNPQMQTQMASDGRAGGFGQPPGQIAPTASTTASPEPTDTREPTVTDTPQTYPAEQTARAYCSALESGDFSAAVELVSAFSKTVTGKTSNEISAALTELKSRGGTCSNLEVVASQIWDQKTALVHVTYTAQAPGAAIGKTTETTQDEIWPFRLEAGRWLYNWTNLIDYKTLSVDAQQVAGLTLKPMGLIRYTDKIRLVLLAQNNTNSPIVIGLPSQTLATFHFDGESVDAVQEKILFDAYRSYPDVTVDVSGLYEQFPELVEIVQFKNSAAAPWFTFGLVE